MTTLRDDYVAAIEAENELLRERIAMLEGLLGMRVEVPLPLALTGNEARLFGLLMKRELVTRDAAMVALYGGRPSADVAEVKIVDVHICKMRPKLRAFGIEINTKWGQGFYMPPDSKARALALMPPASPPVQSDAA